MKKVFRVGSKEIDVINNACIRDAYKDLYLSKKTWREVSSRHAACQWFEGTAGY